MSIEGGGAHAKTYICVLQAQQCVASIEESVFLLCILHISVKTFFMKHMCSKAEDNGMQQ